MALFERKKLGDILGPPTCIDAAPLHLMHDIPNGDSDGDH